MKLSLLLVTVISMSSFAHSENKVPPRKAESYKMAHIYAGLLLKEFDKELLLGSKNILKSQNYMNLLKTREYIESQGYNPNIENNRRIIEITDAKKYNEVVQEIQSNDLEVKFPSVEKNGNIIGHEFPLNTWSLTFDDGPRGQRTRTIVDNLYTRGIKATFFMLTAEVKKYLSTAEYVKDAGMEIALHSYTHESLNKASDERLEYEVTQAKIDMEELLNVKLTNFRLPYGAGMRDERARAIIAKNKLMHVFWNVDTLDWKDKNSESVFNRTKLQMSRSNSGVILFHDIQKPTVITSELVMDYLIEEDKNICTIQEAIDAVNGKSADCIKQEH